MTGVPPSGSGSRASHEAAKASSPEASIPNAAFTAGELQILVSQLPSANNTFHLYLADTNGRKVAALWGSSEEKMANGHLWSAAAEMLDQLDLFIRWIEYQIRVAEKKGDDEGARLQTLTLSIAKSVAAKARGEAL